MTMAIHANQHHRFPLNLDHMSSYSSQPPQFTNPWVSSPSAAQNHQPTSHSMYMGGQPGMQTGPMSLGSLKSHQQHHQQQPQHSSPQVHHHQAAPQPPHPQQQHLAHTQHHHSHHLQQHPTSHPSAQTPSQQAPSNQLHRVTSTGRDHSLAAYASVPVPASASEAHKRNDVYVGQRDMLSLPQDILNLGRIAPPQTPTTFADASYTAPSPIHPAYPTSTPYDQMGYAPAPLRPTYTMAPEADSRRYSQPQPNIQNDDRRSFADAIEASHGIMSLSQETPRPFYNQRTRGSADAYGFPAATHSTSSSVSSTSFNSFYGGGSVDSSVSDYSTTAADMESAASRALPVPRTQGYMAGPTQAPPAPQSMMTQFSSKMTSAAQKKHKCKVCDKRFTRPSSLQTHMYSHTGEKPFCCDVEGCGRHFSVVSNLRRHRKVHKDQAASETGSEDHHSE